MLAALIAIGVVYRLWLDWLYVPSVLRGVLTLAYAYSIRCPYCRERQVFRGWSFFDIRLPTDKCYRCGSPI